MPKDIVSLRQDRAKAYEAATALGAATTDEEHAALDAALGEVETLDRQIASAERMQRLRGSTALGGEDVNGNGATFGSLGEQLVAVAREKISGQRDPRLSWQTFQAAAGQNEGAGADGGFLVQQEFSSELLKLAFDGAILAPRTRRVPIGPNANGLRINAVKETSRATGSRFGGIRGYWTAEGGEKTASAMKFRQMDLKLHKLAGLAYVTDELLEDATALENVLKQAFADEFGFLVDDAIFEGTGAGQPFGIMNSAALVTVPKESSQTADTVTVENIVKMWSRMWSRSRRNAIWTINQQIEPQLFTMKIGDTPVYLPAGGVSAAPYATLMGRPVVPTEFNSALGDKGDIVLMDLTQYLLIEKGGLKSDVSMHVRFVYDEMTFRFVLRVDGQPIWDAPLTPFKGTDTLSPFVTLAERA